MNRHKYDNRCGCYDCTSHERSLSARIAKEKEQDEIERLKARLAEIEEKDTKQSA